MDQQETQSETSYDISIIRPEMRSEDFKIRGRQMERERLKAIKKGLRTLNTLELMASTIYRFQMTGEDWDGWWGNYAPDPKVCFFKNNEEPPDDEDGAVFCTREEMDEYYVLYNEGFDTQILYDDDWLIMVWDMDDVWHDVIDYFGFVRIPVNYIKDEGMTLNGGSSELRIGIELID